MDLVLYVVGYKGEDAMMKEILDGVEYISKEPTNKPLSRALRYFTKIKMQNEHKRISSYPRIYYLVGDKDFGVNVMESSERLFRKLKGAPLIEVLAEFDYNYVSNIRTRSTKDPYVGRLGAMNKLKQDILEKIDDIKTCLEDDIEEYKIFNNKKHPKNVVYRAFRSHTPHTVNFKYTKNFLNFIMNDIEDIENHDFASDKFIMNTIIGTMKDDGKLDSIYIPKK